MNQQTQSQLPYQLDVYFPAFQEIDPDQLARFVNECDPDEKDPCTVEKVADDADMPLPAPEGGVQLHNYLASLGEMHMMIMLHSVPSPAAEMIQSSRLAQPVKQALGMHQAFAMLSAFGGERYAPYEKLLFLYKVAMGLCEQGGSGLGNPHTGLVLPGPLLQELADACADAEEGQGLSLWQSLRTTGTPMQLLADVGGFKDNGSFWLATRGFAFCGFPDLLYQCATPEETEEISEIFESIFAYQMVNGPVIQAGHTMGQDENVDFHFANVPAELKIPFDHYDMLLLSRQAKKRKKFFGLF